MKKLMTLACFAVLMLTACGPAAEDRELMHRRAKSFQDSIANLIRMQMAEAESPAPMMVQPDTSAKAASQGQAK